MAEVCLAGFGEVDFAVGDRELWSGPSVQVRTDHPATACMASQYAGWKLEGSKFFAMGSGPMRAAGSREALFDQIGQRERPTVAIGVLETRKIPPDDVCRQVAEACGVAADRLTLLVAPTASQAGTVQIVARSVETALHKLNELGFDVQRIESGFGVAPLPPVAADDMVGIGRTNDAILYGGEVMLWVRGDDESLQKIGPKVPSSASSAHGEPFADIFARHNSDFYAIDPMLFSPAVVTFNNLDTGHLFRFGHTVPRVIHRSFGM
jgi:methenyltetrahydromethanopterin cyclohydrolase